MALSLPHTSELYISIDEHQLQTSSNTRNQATIQDGRAMGAHIIELGMQCSRHENSVIYNGQDCAEANAQENEQCLDEEEQLFLASIWMTAMIQDVDDEQTAQSIFMANLSSARPANLQAGLSNASILSECSIWVNSNGYPYEQYFVVHNISVVPSCGSSVLNNACVLSDNDAFVPHDPIATDLKIYMEQVAISAQRIKGCSTASRFEVVTRVNQVWKATGKLFTTIGHQWRPTGRLLPLADQWPLTRNTPPKVLPTKQWKPTSRLLLLGRQCPLVRSTALKSDCMPVNLQETITPIQWDNVDVNVPLKTSTYYCTDPQRTDDHSCLTSDGCDREKAICIWMLIGPQSNPYLRLQWPFDAHQTSSTLSLLLDEQWFYLSKDTLRDALQIIPVDRNNAFTSPSTPDALIKFANDLGYSKVVRHLSDVVTNDMFQPWRTLTTIINLCL
ncbi:hypothetical protein Tco_0373403, partial [Tanacetum coccineum]